MGRATTDDAARAVGATAPEQHEVPGGFEGQREQQPGLSVGSRGARAVSYCADLHPGPALAGDLCSAWFVVAWIYHQEHDLVSRGHRSHGTEHAGAHAAH